MKNSSVKSEKNFSQINKSLVVYSTDMIRLKNNLKNLEDSELKLLSFLLENSPVIKGGGHDLFLAGKDWSNSHLGTILNMTQETARRAKESLHARGIILVDGLYYDEYFEEKNGVMVRLRTQFRQHVKFTDEFLNFVADNLGNQKIDVSEPFNWHPAYVAIRQMRQERSRQSKIAWVLRTAQNLLAECKDGVNNLLNSCEKVHLEYVPKNDSPVHIPNVPNLIQENSNSEINIKLLNSRGDYLKHSKISSNAKAFGSVSSVINHMMSQADAAIKEWKEATTKICDSLVKSGKTYHEVGLLMVQQRYCRSLIEFGRLYKPSPG